MLKFPFKNTNLLKKLPTHIFLLYFKVFISLADKLYSNPHFFTQGNYALHFKALNQHRNDIVKWIAHSNKNMVVETDCKVVNSSLLISHYIISTNT